MNKPRTITVSDVFKTQGVPTYTYVSTSDGSYEQDLREAIANKGTLCLITGPSKTGKTTLVKNVCSLVDLQPIVVRCNQDLTPSEFWRKALERVTFDRITSGGRNSKTTASLGSGVEGKLGWQWLASLTGKVSTNLTKERSEEHCRERILADPGPEHLVPVLQRLPYFLVVEDFHYLRPDSQINIFQQWKTFVDEEVSVAVLGTSHRACDLAFANKDLVGRIRHIQMTTWSPSDLREIAVLGFDALNLEVSNNAIASIAGESGRFASYHSSYLSKARNEPSDSTGGAGSASDLSITNRPLRPVQQDCNFQFRRVRADVSADLARLAATKERKILYL